MDHNLFCLGYSPDPSSIKLYEEPSVPKLNYQSNIFYSDCTPQYKLLRRGNEMISIQKNRLIFQGDGTCLGY
jgi:hypothetical protein